MNNRVEALLNLNSKIEALESKSDSKFLKAVFKFLRWPVMVAQECVRDEVQVRAESLTFLTLFSMLPIIAGAFLVAGFLSRFGPVQEKLQTLIGELLLPIPEEHRVFVLQFILSFQDSYIKTLEQKGASLGVFAVGVLIYVAAKVYFNVESVMNLVWSVETPRPFFDRLKNFVMAMVGVPLLGATALTLPTFLPPLVSVFFPFLVIWFWFSVLMRTLPNAKVEWRAAFAGGAFITLTWFLLSFFMKVYFKFGANAAYGKAAAVPLVAFWIYLMWLMVMVGTELAFVTHNRTWIFRARKTGPWLESAAVLAPLLNYFNDRFETGKQAATEPELLEKFKIGRAALFQAIRFLEDKKVIVEAQDDDSGIPVFLLIHRVNDPEIKNLRAEFCGGTDLIR